MMSWLFSDAIAFGLLGMIVGFVVGIAAVIAVGNTTGPRF